MAPHEIALPDAKLHIAKLAKAFPKLPNDATLELRMLKFDGIKPQSKSRRFDPTNLFGIYEQALGHRGSHRARCAGQTAE